MVRALAAMMGTPAAGALIRGSAKEYAPCRFQYTSILVKVFSMTVTAAMLRARVEVGLTRPREGVSK